MEERLPTKEKVVSSNLTRHAKTNQKLERSQTMAYIYKITNELNSKCYIGKTEKGNPEERFYEHLKAAKRFSERPLYRAINKYGLEYFSFEVLEETSEPESREVYWIQHYNSYGSTGYNATLGGDGKKYLNHEKIIKDYEEKQDATEVARLNNCSAGYVRKILEYNEIEILGSSTVLQKKKGKIVEKYSLSGELLETFPSIIKAGLSMGGEQKHRHIGAVCNGKRKTAYGFVWKFKE
jgi:group I intron endonuclease